MTRRPGFFGYGSKDRYIDELLENQEKELKELRKNREDKGVSPLAKQAPDGGMQKDNPYAPQEEALSKKETARLLGSALAGALLIGTAFMGAIFLFLLFCVNVWFS